MYDFDDLRDRMEEIPPTSGLAFSLMGTGVGMTVYMLATRKRGFLAWAIPGALLAGGLALLAGGFSHKRTERINEAEQAVRDELAGLDPFARARILSDMASETAAPLIRRFTDHKAMSPN